MQGAPCSVTFVVRPKTAFWRRWCAVSAPGATPIPFPCSRPCVWARCAAGALATGAYGPAAALWVCNRIVDGLDGAVARATAVLLACCYVNLTSWLHLSVLFERNRGSTGAGSTSRRITSIEMPSGLVEGAETILAYLLLMLFPRYGVVILWVTASAILIGATQRVVWACRAFGPCRGP